MFWGVRRRQARPLFSWLPTCPWSSYRPLDPFLYRKTSNVLCVRFWDAHRWWEVHTDSVWVRWSILRLRHWECWWLGLRYGHRCFHSWRRVPQGTCKLHRRCDSWAAGWSRWLFWAGLAWRSVRRIESKACWAITSKEWLSLCSTFKIQL